MTPDERRRRKEDENVKFLSKKICRCDSDKKYVFISYKSDDWEIVLKDIVYKLVHDYNLNVYFDGDFDVNNPIWTEQFPENMKADNCLGVLAFIDTEYTESYATLMELLYSQVGCKRMRYPYDTIIKPVVPINLDKIMVSRSDEDTGLGVEEKDGKANIHAADEKELFDELFESAREQKILKRTVKPYEQAIKSSGKNHKLIKELCASMCREVLAHIGANDNFYGEGVGIEDIVLTIKNTFTEAVFDLHSDNKNVKTESLISEIKEKSEDSFKNTIKNKPIEVKSEIDSSSYAVNNIISGDKASNDRVPKTKLSDGPFSYTIFGKEYFSTGQADLMYNAFAALIEKYPNVAEKLTVRTSVARAEDVKNAGTKAAYPTYFRGCKVFKIGNLEYLVGTSYGFEEKLKEIKGMFRLCGADISQFVLNGESLSDNKKIKQVNSEEENLDLEEKIYKYTIFGKEYSSRGQANLMYDTFEALVARYPNLVERLTNRTCVSKAENVQNAGTKESNPVYFRGCRLFIVEGKEYLVGNSYSFDAKLAEIKGMLKLCGVREDEFQLISAPEKSKRNTTI